MKPPIWVLDTNVVVSGLLVAAGFSGRLLDAVLSGRLRISYEPAGDLVESPKCVFLFVLLKPDGMLSPAWEAVSHQE